ncbi:MAG: tRNA dihydrouridine(20/20a) synthase DusA [Inquilinaceae bacterium]
MPLNAATEAARFSVAPMMDWTDRHDRFFLRLITRRTRLYTEMITAAAVLHGDRDRLLGFSAEERPLALQVGGSDPGSMARVAEIAERAGFDEININVGCPSDRVQSGRFGACLMAEPATVAACVAAMGRATGLPVTVKTRIGIDDQDPAEALPAFVDTVAGAGCTVFIVHARKAWLKGLSPRQNRDVPPLDYDLVYRLKADRPDLTIVLNGGVNSLDEAEAHLAAGVDGVMIGRAAYQTPYSLAEADRRFFGDTAPIPTREQIVQRLIPYTERLVDQGIPLTALTRHILGLFQGCPGARAWRRFLSENAHRPGAGAEVIVQAMDQMRERNRRAA